MKKIYCELHLFDLHQTIYVVDTDTGSKEAVAIATMEELPEIINAVSRNKQLPSVWLSGNSVLGSAIAEDIVAYSKMHYNDNNIEVEVLK